MIASAGHDAKIVVLKHQNCVQAGRASNHITSRPQRAIHTDGNGGLGNSTSLFWTAKKAAEENEDFSVRKSSFSDRILRSIWANIFYNIARVLALYKSYWAAMNKIFIYARPCVNKMTWAFFFFTWLQSCRLLSCSALFLLFKIWKKPAKNCPIFLSALTF